MASLKDTDKLIELIDDDIASLDMNMPTESYYVCLCTLQMVKLYIEALPTVPLDYKSIIGDWAEHDNAMIAKGREIERRLNAPKHGRWILRKVYEDEYGNEQFNYFCSKCGVPAYEFSQPYCHRCGARMDEVEE